MSPTINAWRTKGQPQLYAELCTKFGFVKISVAGDEKPSKSESHAPECAMCLPAATWLGFANSDSPSVPPVDGAFVRSPTVPHAARALVAHTLAWTHAPPAYA